MVAKNFINNFLNGRVNTTLVGGKVLKYFTIKT